MHQKIGHCIQLLQQGKIEVTVYTHELGQKDETRTGRSDIEICNSSNLPLILYTNYEDIKVQGKKQVLRLIFFPAVRTVS